MNTTFDEPRLATTADLQTILNLIKEAAGWLHTMGTDQWSRPWPSRRERDDRIRDSVAAKATWILWDGATAVATITAHRDGHERLWTPEELLQPAVYLHRIVVSREYAGRRIGARLIDWATNRAALKYGARQTRIDVWATNEALHKYYEAIGFEFVRRADYPGYPSNALFQRPVETRGWPGRDASDV